MQDGLLVLEQLRVENLVRIQGFETRLNVVTDDLRNVDVQIVQGGGIVGIAQIGVVREISNDLRPEGENVMKGVGGQTKGSLSVHVQHLIHGETKELLDEQRIVVDADQFVQLSIGFQTSDQTRELVQGLLVGRQTGGLIKDRTHA